MKINSVLNSVKKETKTKKKSLQESKPHLRTVVVGLECFDEDQRLREFVFATTVGWINLFRSAGESLDKNDKEELMECIYAEGVDNDFLFEDINEDDQYYSDHLDVIFQYSALIQAYLGHLHSVSEFLEKDDFEYVLISISIDVSDVSKTKIIGNYFKDGYEDKKIDYQLN